MAIKAKTGKNTQHAIILLLSFRVVGGNGTKVFVCLFVCLFVCTSEIDRP